MSSQLKAQLDKIKDKEGNTLTNHLSNLLTKLLLDDPHNAYYLFEDESLNIKQSKYDFRKHNEFQDNAERLREKYEAVSESFKANKKLLDPLMEGEEDNLAPVGAIGYVPNFMEEAKWFEWAGVGFGEEESYRIFRALTVLSNAKKEKGLKNVRLWGKIHCTNKDYYIAEGQADFEDYGELPPEVEPLGGDEPSVNQLNYYVTTDLVQGNWVELPPITPQQIILSRRIKYVFTGDLNRKVITNPHFESNVKPANNLQYSVGTEKELLKCMIVRISHCCSVQPRGLKLVDPEDATGRTLIDPDENFTFPEFQALSSLNGWVHSKQNILNEGKLKHTIPEAQEGEEQEDVEKRTIAKDPFEPLMKPLNTDNAPEGYKSAWILRTHGDQTDYGVAQKPPADQPNKVIQQNYGYISIKNLYWPGHVTIYHNKKWQNLYIGQGFKQSQEFYYPKEPEFIQEEQPELPCQVEPVPPEEKQQEPEEGGENQQQQQEEEEEN
ncbi:hypothetical protein ABPG74_020864 [Tetrahymena malaccensis]